MKFNKRIGNIEVRSCTDSLTSEKPHTTAEIIQWSDTDSEYCWTTAFFKKDSEGDFDLMFVGGRPFDGDIDTDAFMRLAKKGYAILTQESDISDDEQNIRDNLVDAWNTFLELPDTPLDDKNDFMFHIHALQRIIAFRDAKRFNPDIWGG